MKFYWCIAFFLPIFCNAFGQEVTKKNIFDLEDLPKSISINHYFDRVEKKLIALEDKEKLYDYSYLLVDSYYLAFASKEDIDVGTRVIRLVNILAEKDLYFVLIGGYEAGSASSNLNKKGNIFGIKFIAFYDCTPAYLETKFKEMYNRISKKKLNEKFGESWIRIFN